MGNSGVINLIGLRTHQSEITASKRAINKKKEDFVSVFKSTMKGLKRSQDKKEKVYNGTDNKFDDFDRKDILKKIIKNLMSCGKKRQSKEEDEGLSLEALLTTLKKKLSDSDGCNDPLCKFFFDLLFSDENALKSFVLSGQFRAESETAKEELPLLNNKDKSGILIDRQVKLGALFKELKDLIDNSKVDVLNNNRELLGNNVKDNISEDKWKNFLEELAKLFLKHENGATSLVDKLKDVNNKLEIKEDFGLTGVDSKGHPKVVDMGKTKMQHLANDEDNYLEKALFNTVSTNTKGERKHVHVGEKINFDNREAIFAAKGLSIEGAKFILGDNSNSIGQGHVNFERLSGDKLQPLANRIVMQVADNVKQAVIMNKIPGGLKVRLHPPNLGNLQIELKYGQDNQLEIHIVSEREITHHILKQHVHDLKSHIAEALHGMEPKVEFSVTPKEDNTGFLEYQQNGSGSKRDYGRGKQGSEQEAQSDEEFSELLSSAVDISV